MVPPRIVPEENSLFGDQFITWVGMGSFKRNLRLEFSLNFLRTFVEGFISFGILESSPENPQKKINF